MTDQGTNKTGFARDDELKKELHGGLKANRSLRAEEQFEPEPSSRDQPTAEVAKLNHWATGGLMPDLTVLLDMPPAGGLGRRARSADRLEAEPLDFHERVRRGFLSLAREDPDRYLVLDASQRPEDVSRAIQDRVREMLPDPIPPMAEANTGSFPAIVDEVWTGK